jgi:predicted ribosome quality control (RQC) complex YloA/Tae2 family protein
VTVELGPAKDRFTALDTLALVREARGLVGGRLDKVFVALPAGYSFVFRVPGAGRRELHVVSGHFAAVGVAPPDHAAELDPLAKELRRLLSGAQLAEVPDPAGERYLELVLRRPDVEGPLLVGAELFGGGNLVVAREGRLVAVEHARRWAHRTVRIGAEYVRPPTRLNALEAPASTLEGILRESRTDRASTLAARLGLGGPLAEELLARAGLAGTVAAATDCADAATRLVAATRALLAEVGAAPRGHLYLLGEMPVDVAPTPLVRWQGIEGLTHTETATFSEAAERYFSALPPTTRPAPSPSEEARRELERQREQQARAVDALRATVAALKEQAEAILAHYVEAEERLASVPGDEGDDVVETEVGGVVVPLLRGRSVRDSASVLYDSARRLKSKLEGAEAALGETDGRLRLLHEVRPPARGESAAGGPTPPRAHRARWFEKYRWFFTSDGVLVIGGRDAASNDLVVRRYLNPGDVYVHADVHGAPSVIVKHPPPGAPPVSDDSLRQAGQWGFCFSKAWRAGLASGTAFWVTPDQVSKAGASGEFVPRGAWVIHGTKNYLRDLPAELALGTVPVDGDELWTVAPPDSLRTRGTIRVLLSPGDDRGRGAVEVDLARALGLSRDRLQSLLPAGGITARRV